MRARQIEPRRVVARLGLTLLLGLFVVAVYAAVVLVGGALLGVGGGPRPPLALSVLATVLVAVSLEPLAARLEPALRRLTGAAPSTPYEVLRRFSAQVGEVHALEEVAPRMAHVLASGTGAALTEVWVAVGPGLERVAAWPPDTPEHTSLRVLPDRRLVTSGEDDLAVPVSSGAVLLGALVVRPAAEPLTSVERRLVADLAAQAGLVLRNVAVATDLQVRIAQSSAQAAQVTASRARLVAAQDATRQRLERDIHDGAQQHLVALVVNLRLVRTLLGRAPAAAADLLPGLRSAVARTETALHDLVRGVYPRVLTEAGLLAALQEAATTAPVPVRVLGEPARRPEPVEAAVWFCCLEALQNAVKHAGATCVTIELSDEADGGLAFTVSDDGAGFDPDTVRDGSGLHGMADRLEPLGGAVQVRSAPGAGTVVRGRLPAPSRTEALA